MLNVIESPSETVVHHGHINFEVASLSDVGNSKAGNKDAMATVKLSLNQHEDKVPMGLCIVADGMGGRQVGRVVADIAVLSVVQEVTNHLSTLETKIDDGIFIRKMLEDCFIQAHQNILSAPCYTRGMGTTLVAALVINDTAYFASVGNARGYLFNGRILRQITSDHSMAWLLASRGRITKKDICYNPQRNVLLQALGSTENIKVDLFCEPVAPGYEILLCSNGLWEAVWEDHIEEVLRRDTSLYDKACNLIDTAKASGGTDNMTVVIVKAK